MKIQLLNILIVLLLCSCGIFEKEFCISGEYTKDDESLGGTVCVNKELSKANKALTFTNSEGRVFYAISKQDLDQANQTMLVGRSQIRSMQKLNPEPQENLPLSPVQLFRYLARNPVPIQQPLSSIEK